MNYCPHCQNPYESGPTCPACGQELPVMQSAGETTDRARWKVIFWIAFFVSPFTAILNPALVVLGALLAGYALAMVFAKSHLSLVLLTLVFWVGVAAIYGAIVFAGCLILMRGNHI